MPHKTIWSFILLSNFKKWTVQCVQSSWVLNRLNRLNSEQNEQDRLWEYYCIALMVGIFTGRNLSLCFTCYILLHLLHVCNRCNKCNKTRIFKIVYLFLVIMIKYCYFCIDIFTGISFFLSYIYIGYMHTPILSFRYYFLLKKAKILFSPSGMLNRMGNTGYIFL